MGNNGSSFKSLKYLLDLVRKYKWPITGIVIATACCMLWPHLHEQSNNLIHEPQSKTEEVGKSQVMNQVKETFTRLGKLFPNQTKRFWRVSSAAIRSLLAVDDPKRPAVILLAASKSNSQVLNCLAKKMSEAVNQLINGDEIPVAEFDCRQHEHGYANDVKLALNAKLSEAFGNGTRVGLVLAVDSLPGNSPMIFYRLCDTANAPFKDVVIILTLNLKEEPISEEETNVHEELKGLWSPYFETDQINPIFSRIGNSVVYVHEEADLSICSAEMM